MLLVVLVLACTVTLAGGFVVGVCVGRWEARGRRDAGGIAPHEALRPLYRAGGPVHGPREWSP